MTAPSTRTSGVPTDFYAPSFSIDLDGRPLDPERHANVREIKVERDLTKLSSADLTLNTYDDSTFDLMPERFRINSRVHVQLGYADRLLSVLHGYVVTLAHDFPEHGSPTLTVRVVDSLTKLRNSKPPQDSLTYRKTTAAGIARRIAQRWGLEIDTSDGGPEYELVTQRNLDDALFLKERAALIDWQAFIDVDPESGAERLRFVTPADGRAADPVRTFVLAWGSLASADVPASLISFKPTVAAGDQVQSVEVRGWDVQRKQPIAQKATRAPGVRPTGTEESGPQVAAGIGGAEGRQDVVVDRPVETDEQALELAQALLADASYRFFTAHGRTVGLPDLRPGDNVEVHGVGPTFSGTYYVTHVMHTLGDKGFFTEFDCRRSDP
jgi:phage protein D